MAIYPFLWNFRISGSSDLLGFNLPVFSWNLVSTVLYHKQDILGVWQLWSQIITSTLFKILLSQ